MKLDKALGTLVLVAGSGLLMGMGFLAYMVGKTWTEATTQSLVTGLVAVCGGGAVVLVLLVSLIVGIPMAIRYLEGMGRARQSWPATSPAGTVQGRVVEERPPLLLADADEGSWDSPGVAGYDLWEEEPVSRSGEW